jgi:hypothetical protein
MQKLMVLILILVGLAACERKGAGNAGASAGIEDVAAQLPAGFADFYEQFHADSLYQVAHILWPLPGATSMALDSLRTQRINTTWQQESWRMHRPVDLSTGEFKRTFMPLSDDIVVEKIRYAAANYGLERRFARRSNGEWELIFYSDMLEGR